MFIIDHKIDLYIPLMRFVSVLNCAPCRRLNLMRISANEPFDVEKQK